MECDGRLRLRLVFTMLWNVQLSWSLALSCDEDAVDTSSVLLWLDDLLLDTVGPSVLGITLLLLMKVLLLLEASYCGT